MSGGSSLCCGGCSDKGAECAAFAAGRCGHRPLQSSKNRTSFDFHTSNIYRTAIYECRNCYARPKGVRTMVGITITRTTERLVFQARKRYSRPQRLFFCILFSDKPEKSMSAKRILFRPGAKQKRRQFFRTASVFFTAAAATKAGSLPRGRFSSPCRAAGTGRRRYGRRRSRRRSRGCRRPAHAESGPCSPGSSAPFPPA